MELLIDTHAFVWFINANKKLSDKAKETIESADFSPVISIASFWEITIKLSLGKIDIKSSLMDFIEKTNKKGFRILPVQPNHLFYLPNLPFHHRDPFDRMLIAQAISENMTIVTKDPDFKKYDVPVLW